VTTKIEHVFGHLLSYLLRVAILAAFGYFAYLLFQWLFLGAGEDLLLFGLLIGLIYFVFGWLPGRMSQRTGRTVRESTRSIQLFILFMVGAAVGAYWVPRVFDLKIAWYWRPPLAFAVGIIALMTRRYP
jgi:multisubunit Na+/H+ antiporter MnhB subunit